MARAASLNEATSAQRLLDSFVARLHDAGIAPEPLQATLLNGARVKTDRAGWYLNQARTLAVGADASYLSLVTTGNGLARFTGVKLHPSTPTLVIGRGGRDGETGDLADFLDRAWQHYAEEAE